MPHRNKLLVVIRSLLLMLVCLVALTISARASQTVCGRVVDEATGLPVAQAEIKLQHTGWQTYTDSDGRFCLEHVPDGDYRAVVSAVGHDSPASFDVAVHDDVTPELLFHLSPRSHALPGIRVEDSTAPMSTREYRVIEREHIQGIQADDLADILAEAGGLYVVRSGSGQARATVRGSASKQVLVLVDGHRMNAASDGEFDLSSIPAEMIERVEVYTSGAAAEFGPDALAGAVNVITRVARSADPLAIEWALGGGDWGTNRVAASVSSPLQAESFDVRGAYVRQATDGNYPFAYTVDDAATVHTGQRVNNSAESSSWFISGRWLASQKLMVDFSGQVYGSENGLPGRAVDQDSSSFRTDDRVILGASGRLHLGGQSELLARAGWTTLEQHFEDPTDPSPLTGMNSDYTDDVLTAGIMLDASPWTRQTLRAGVDLQADALKHTDHLRESGSLGRTRRTNVGMFVKSEQVIDIAATGIIDRITLRPSVRVDTYDSDATADNDDASGDSDGRSWSPHLGLGASRQVGDWLHLSADASYGRSFRLPQANALFWQGDAMARGNPDLRPERAEQSEAGLNLLVTPPQWPVTVEGGVTYFHRYTRDIIVWTQGYGGVWQPVNLAAERATGHEDYLKISAFDKLLSMHYQNTVTDSRSRVPGHATYGKALPFVPAFVQQLSVRMDHSVGFARITSRHVGKRWATQANTRYYDSYRVTDLALGVHARPLNWLRCTLEYKAANIGNEHYVLTSHYPMPGREWMAGLTLTIATEDDDD